MSTSANCLQPGEIRVDLETINRRLVVLQYYADLLTQEITLLHQLLPALRTPELPGMEASPSQSPFGAGAGADESGKRN